MDGQLRGFPSSGFGYTPTHRFTMGIGAQMLADTQGVGAFQAGGGGGAGGGGAAGGGAGGSGADSAATTRQLSEGAS